MVTRSTATLVLFSAVLLALSSVGGSTAAGEDGEEQKKLLQRLKQYPHRIVYETYRETNWELYRINADGSNPINLTRTPDADEMYPHASPDGTKICFVAEEGKVTSKVRNVYYVKMDGTGRTKVGENGRQPFWSPDGRLIGYLRGTRVDYREGGRDNRELHFYDVETGKHSRHPPVEIGGRQREISGLLNPCWSPDGTWIITSHMAGGMGLDHSIVAIEARGTKVVVLRRSGSEAKDIWQCRPDVSPDGRRIAWAKEDGGDYMWAEVGDIDLSLPEPKVTNLRCVATVEFPLELYHVDWSPDGTVLAYTQGGRGTKMQPAGYVVGTKAAGWDIRVVDPSQPEVVLQITRHGMSNKEPDWVPVVRKSPRQ